MTVDTAAACMALHTQQQPRLCSTGGEAPTSSSARAKLVMPKSSLILESSAGMNAGSRLACRHEEQPKQGLHEWER